jgi:hypothetical protein
VWEKANIHGKSAFILKEKMKILKEALKGWNKEVFGIVDLNLEKTVKELNDVEDMLANDDYDPTHLNSKELVKKFWDELRTKDSLIRQKSRSQWIQEGDANSRFFHASIKARRRRNQIVSLMKGADMIQGVQEIKSGAKNHFSQHFSEEWSNRPFLEGITFPSISSDDNVALLEPFHEEEIRETIWSCDGNKSPGPDGFNLNFLKACWSIVKKDVIAFFKEFHENAFLPKALTSSFLTLIPKKDHPLGLHDYRPICLIGSITKSSLKLWQID